MGIMDVDYETTKAETKDFGRDNIKASVIHPHQTTLAFMESLTMPHVNSVQEVVISADVRCTECQKRVVEMISRLTETESVVVNLLEKKVIITCKYLKASKNQIITGQKNIFSSGKVSLIKRIFGSSKRT